MRPTPNIALSAYFFASCARHCVTKTPNSDIDLRSPRDVEHARIDVHHCMKAELGALAKIVDKLLGRCPVLHTYDAVSSSTVLATYCELEWTES